jgi:hypothetical protein
MRRNAFDAVKSGTRASLRGLGPGNQDFLGSVKWHRGPLGKCHLGANPLPLAQVMDLHASKALRTGPYQSEVHK